MESKFPRAVPNQFNSPNTRDSCNCAKEKLLCDWAVTNRKPSGSQKKTAKRLYFSDSEMVTQKNMEISKLLKLTKLLSISLKTYIHKKLNNSDLFYQNHFKMNKQVHNL